MTRVKAVVASGWIGLSLFVLLYTVLTPTSPETREKGIFFAWAMLVLTFPIGAVLSTLVALIEPLVPIGVRQVMSTSAAGFVIAWTALVLCGYVQWFVLVPRLARHIRERRFESAVSIVPSDAAVDTSSNERASKTDGGPGGGL